MFTEFTWWSVIFLLVTTHITILTVTVYLHRAVSHRALTLNKWIEHFFRFWGWFTTGQSTRQWAAVHRKHHAFCEKDGDPHSPKIFGLKKVFFQGVSLYRTEAKNPETIEKYGKFTPNDWLENKLYENYSWLGLVVLLLIDVAFFGVHGTWVWLAQILWIPFWAAGVVNGVGHVKGYRNFNTDDQSRNICPIGFIIGGEELHNNHHAYPTSAKLSMRWYEFDMGWGWIKAFEFFKLAKINKQYSFPVFDKKKEEIDGINLQAFLSNKSYVLKMFFTQTKASVQRYIEEVKKQDQGLNEYSIKKLKQYFYESYDSLKEEEKKIVFKLLQNEKLKAVFNIKESMIKIWNEKNLNYNQLLEKLTVWQKEAYNHGMHDIKEFSQKILWLKNNNLQDKLISV